MLTKYNYQYFQVVYSFLQITLRKKGRYSDLFWSLFSHIWTEYRNLQSNFTYSVQMQDKTKRKNSKYGHFSRSVIGVLVYILKSANNFRDILQWQINFLELNKLFYFPIKFQVFSIILENSANLLNPNPKSRPKRQLTFSSSIVVIALCSMINLIKGLVTNFKSLSSFI